MRTVINGLPLNIEFNFSGNSEDKLMVVAECCSNNKPFILYASDGDYELFIPEWLMSFDNYKQSVKYTTREEFNIALGFCVMVYDYATGMNAIAHLQLHTSLAPPALSPG